MQSSDGRPAARCARAVEVVVSMSETEFIVEPVDLGDLRAAIEALTALERFEIVAWWSKVRDGIGGSASRWFEHWVDQRTQEVRGVRRVELGPTSMMGPGLIGGLGELVRWQTASIYQSRAQSRYYSELSIVFSERAVFGPAGRRVK